MTHPTWIHPGFEKSATTTLQDHVFALHPQIANIARPFDDRSHALGLALARPYGLYDAAATAELVAGLTVARTGPETRIRMVSEEYATGNVWTRFLMPERFKALFPEARILFTIRRQLDSIRSYYGLTGRRLIRVPQPYVGRHVALEDYLEFAWERWDDTFLANVDYEPVIAAYERAFGRENVHVVLHEDLVAGRDAFLERLCAILDIDAEGVAERLGQGRSNARSTEKLVAYHQLRSRLLPGVPLRQLIPGGEWLRARLHQSLAKGRSLEVEIPDAWAERLSERYREGNRRLAERYQLPLQQRGYPL